MRSGTVFVRSAEHQVSVGYATTESVEAAATGDPRLTFAISYMYCLPNDTIMVRVQNGVRGAG